MSETPGHMDVTIGSYQPSDFAAIMGFVEALQEHERADVPELKPGPEICDSYARLLLQTTTERNGQLLVAKLGETPIAFACAWVEEDDDPLLRDDARAHAYISDLFVDAAWRGQGVAQRLLTALEAEMRSRGYRRLRVCAKAANQLALECYRTAGYQPYEVTLTKQLP